MEGQGMQAGAIQVGAAADGTLTYLVDRPPEALPPVRRRDLAAAWEAARAAAAREAWGSARLFRFRASDGSATDLALADPDACCWAVAVDSMFGMASLYGLSLCLRLLALVDLMAHSRWADALFVVRRDGAEIDPALLAEAATTGLTREARFDAASMQLKLAGRLLAPGAQS
jgi:hypothetical protein